MANFIGDSTGIAHEPSNRSTEVTIEGSDDSKPHRTENKKLYTLCSPLRSVFSLSL